LRDGQEYLSAVLILAAVCLSALSSSFAQTIWINEVQSANVTTLADQDGDFSDWIELYNPTFRSVDMHGWGLSDDPDTPYKWVFPGISIPPREYLLVFASGKGTEEWPSHWETVIDLGAQWNYFVGHWEPPAGWNRIGFDDSKWKSGPSGFGYADGKGPTLELLNPGLDNSSARNWTASTGGGGTPGRPCNPSGDTDGDGILTAADFVRILHLVLEGYDALDSRECIVDPNRDGNTDVSDLIRIIRE